MSASTMPRGSPTPSSCRRTEKDAIAFLDRALAWFDRLGVGVERVITDNGSAYRSHAFRSRLTQLGIRHIRTRPYTQKPTERPSASFKPVCANGPTPAPITPPRSETKPCSP